jgi:hypothetical protein
MSVVFAGHWSDVNAIWMQPDSAFQMKLSTAVWDKHKGISRKTRNNPLQLCPLVKGFECIYYFGSQKHSQ